jgi:DNA recombination protein RmuC
MIIDGILLLLLLVCIILLAVFKMQEGMDRNAHSNRQELSHSLKNFGESFSNNVADFKNLQKQRFDDMARKQDDLVKSTEERLEKMRQTVDEKLHKTLEERLGKCQNTWCARRDSAG